MFHSPGAEIALRGMFQGQPWYIQAVRVVHDRPDETALLLLPGAECVAPSGYLHQKHGSEGHWERWQEMLNPPWQLEKYTWQTNRFLILLKPDDFYATILIWEHASQLFRGYYINFQLPYRRSACGFDTFDLELDLVIAPDFTWDWKDVADYQRGIESGILLPDWVRGIDEDKARVFTQLAQRGDPFDGRWLNWQPDPAWEPARLPAGWDLPDLPAIPPAAARKPARATVCHRLMTADSSVYPSAEYRGRTIYFCTDTCLEAFRADPDRFYAAHSRPVSKK